ncbi:hypothetical protein EB796_023163 [Bugula neritina]|uniref:Uncharacterized protein n=1 Tax=Bugula neritina TaxID=10212 RepID=A0A7J7IX93_BUGNE|nr:hypothetical protein EB796_023163 [Bugula neritina]
MIPDLLLTSFAEDILYLLHFGEIFRDIHYQCDSRVKNILQAEGTLGATTLVYRHIMVWAQFLCVTHQTYQ